VEDSGRGIPDHKLHRIFEPIYTTKEEGSGIVLGLDVVYGIVNRHHGSIDVDSTPGGGTEFTIELPLRQPPADDETEPDKELAH
jgi:signal transduction histidine kinase